MKIYDGFLFNDELDLLELRLMELGSVVDEFILVEMAHNFQKQPKPLHYQENLARFERWGHRIRHIVVENYQIAAHPAMERFQRRVIGFQGLRGCSFGDILCLGDVDEIPDPTILEKAKSEGLPHAVSLQQRLYYHTVDWELASRWVGTVLVPINGPVDCQSIRDNRYYFPILADGGWHFSWLGSPEQIQNKLRCIDVDADSKLFGTQDTLKAPDPNDLEHIEDCIQNGTDLFRRTEAYAKKTLVPIEPGVRQPRFIEPWLERHPQYARVPA